MNLFLTEVVGEAVIWNVLNYNFKATSTTQNSIA